MRPNTNLEGLTADQIIAILGMSPHPEGGYYVETYRDPNAEALGLPPALADRGSVTCIYFLLKSGESSHWHRVQGVEVWHHYLGAPLLLRIAQRDEDMPTSVQLGSDFQRGERPQGVVPSGAWQAAECLADDPAGYSLVGCSVSPGFTFDGFELAAPAWAPGPHNGE